MKLAGLFEQCSGILLGRSGANTPVNSYTVEVVYNELSDELGILVIYDVDRGHVSLQITFINGAYPEVEVEEGKDIILKYFLSINR